MKIRFINILIIILILILLLVVGLYIYKKTYKSKKLIIIESVIKNNESIVAAGNIGKYPILLKSIDNGKTWKEKNISIFNLLPSNSIYYLGYNDKTIWIHEYKPCIECDFSNKLIRISYSHDFGSIWKSISYNKISESNNLRLEFYNNKQGELIDLNDEKKDYYNTINGGENWKKGKLENKIIKLENPTKKLLITNSKTNNNEYIMWLEKNQITKQNIGILPRKINQLHK